MDNMSMVTEFILMGFAGPWKLQILQDGIFLVIYLTALMGNGLIITITSLDPCLHTPMYFFIRNLSLFDICLISAVVPKTIVNSLTHSNYISFLGCVIQLFLVAFSATTELFLLTMMSIDRYAAICHPLHYEVIMNRGTCVQMVFFSCLTGGFLSMIHTAVTFTFSYCEIIEIHQFFCDIPQLLAISCSKNISVEIALLFINIVLGFCCFICIIISYTYIFSTVRKIPSTEGRSKAYSTCIPHLTVFILFLSTAFGAYLKPILASASFTDLILSAFYIMLPPSLNPIIYGLRNKAMKLGLQKLTTKFLPKENLFLFLQS
ncbi:PREDICTED: olfactory receptor 14A16-like [Chrysochloris asiatica]|uniref:Olfactory receptor n=1 Tax=Chrysochloris asiatica TaxID=185453 RepID=A0A9B0X148_CHRAS|nr:PREDICTED: olfactory receptor 14A16-like [Chrysochloris asiatica]